MCITTRGPIYYSVHQHDIVAGLGITILCRPNCCVVTCRNRFCSTTRCDGSSTTWPVGRRTRNTWRTVRASCSNPLASGICPRSSSRSLRSSPDLRRSRRLLATNRHRITIGIYYALIYVNSVRFMWKTQQRVVLFFDRSERGVGEITSFQVYFIIIIIYTT